MFTRLRQHSYWLMVSLGVLLIIMGTYPAMAQVSLDDSIILADCAPARPAGWVTYVIQPNDTLSGIAARTGSRIQELARVNCITNRRLIMTGAEIFVPVPIDGDILAERCRRAGIEPERCRALIFGDDDNLGERCRLVEIEPERCRALVFGDNGDVGDVSDGDANNQDEGDMADVDDRSTDDNRGWVGDDSSGSGQGGGNNGRGDN